MGIVKYFNPEKLEQTRVKKGWSASELARIIKVSPSTVSRWEKGEHLPSARHAQLLAKALGIPMVGDSGLYSKSTEGTICQEKSTNSAATSAVSASLKSTV